MKITTQQPCFIKSVILVELFIKWKKISRVSDNKHQDTDDGINFRLIINVTSSDII